MKEKSSKLKTDTQTHTVRQNIMAQVVELGDCLKDSDNTDIERRSRALITLIKFTQIIDAQDALDLQASTENNETNYTPYDQIRTPNDKEMRAVQDRLNCLYNKLRSAQDPELGFAGDDEE